ncbi:FUSC family protein [Streptomyces sp. YIM S03343]
MLTFPASARRALRFRPTAWLHLRTATVSMGTVLGTYGCALLVERLAGLRVDSVIGAVVVASALGRAQRAFDRTDRLLVCVVLPCAAAAGSELSTLIQRHSTTGDAVFVLGVAGAIWIRRFGMRAARAGTLIVLPLIAVLVTPPGVPSADGHAGTGWAALTALVAVVWGTVLSWAAHTTGFVPAPPPAWVVKAPARSRPGMAPSTRMAAQTAVALTAAFVTGRNVWPDHWAWVVLTAFLVGSGARSRGDVLVKGAWRTAGAAVGTLVAGALSGSVGPHSDSAVVVMFGVLAVATWLRELSYAYWAACVTAVLSLLYDWFGQSPGDLLDTRLAGIAVGAVIGLAASWLVLPVRTAAVARARTAAALAELGELLGADWRDEHAIRRAGARFTHALDQLTIATAPLRVLAAVPVPHGRNNEALQACTALRACTTPAATLTTAVLSSPAALSTDPTVTHHRTRTAARTASIRRAIARRPQPPTTQAHPLQPPTTPTTTTGTALTAITQLDTQLTTLSALFPPLLNRRRG